MTRHMGRHEKTDSSLHSFWRACLHKDSPSNQEKHHIPPTTPQPAFLSLLSHTSLTALLLSLVVIIVSVRMATSCSLKPCAWCCVPTYIPQRLSTARNRSTTNHTHTPPSPEDRKRTGGGVWWRVCRVVVWPLSRFSSLFLKSYLVFPILPHFDHKNAPWTTNSQAAALTHAASAFSDVTQIFAISSRWVFPATSHGPERALSRGSWLKKKQATVTSASPTRQAPKPIPVFPSHQLTAEEGRNHSFQP